MTARSQATHGHALHKEQAVLERTKKNDHGKTEQGIVKDERGQDQPSDKKRATQNR